MSPATRWLALLALLSVAGSGEGVVAEPGDGGTSGHPDSAVGRLDGVAPGLRLAARWRRFSFYSESEYVIPLDGDGTPFFYAWSQWAWSPLDWLTTGVSVQRLRVTDTGRWIDVGPAVAVSLGRTILQGFLFDPFSSDAYGFVGASVTF